MQLQKSSIVSLNAVTETKLVYCLLFFFGTHWYRARIVYFALSIPASVFPDLANSGKPIEIVTLVGIHRSL